MLPSWHAPRGLRDCGLACRGDAAIGRGSRVDSAELGLLDARPFFGGFSRAGGMYIDSSPRREMVRSPLSRLHLPCFTRDSPDSTVTLGTHCLVYLFFKLVNSYFSVDWIVSP